MKISRSILWNVSGAMLPMLVGVAVMPGIVRNLGVSKFGILSLIWAMIGYFSVFDLGLSRTLTKMTADRVGTPDEGEIPDLIATTLILVAAASLVFSGLVATGSHRIVHDIFHVRATEAPDASVAIIWLAVSLPFVLISTALFGALEGLQKFDATNSVRLPLGIFMFLVPYVVSRTSAQLSTITVALLGLRVAVFAALWVISIRAVPGLRFGIRLLRRDQVKALLSFGGWLTVSNIVGPMLVYFDRFMIALILGSAAVAYYTVPFDALFRILVFPTAIQGVLFPAFAAMRLRSSSAAPGLFKRSSEVIFLVLVPAVFAVILLGRPGLNIWMGPDFASKSYTVAAIMVIGILFNSVARTPIMLVQAYGEAKWTGLLHTVELPVYAAMLWILLKQYGINGAAIAWTARVAIDCIALYVMAIRLEPRITWAASRDLIASLILSIVAIAVGYFIHGVVLRSLVVILLAVPCGLVLLASARSAFFGASTQVSGT